MSRTRQRRFELHRTRYVARCRANGAVASVWDELRAIRCLRKPRARPSPRAQEALLWINGVGWPLSKRVAEAHKDT